MSINANGAGQRTVTILATDSGSGVTTIYYRVYLKGSTAPAYSSVSGASKSFTITGVAGTYLVDYYSVDAVGNLSTVHRLTVGVTGVWNFICLSASLLVGISAPPAGNLLAAKM